MYYGDGLSVEVVLKDIFSEASHVCSHGWYSVRDTLERGVSPWFIIRWEHREVEAEEEVTIFNIKDAVVSIEIGRDKHHFNLVVLGVIQAVVAQGVKHTVVLEVEEMVSNRVLGSGFNIVFSEVPCLIEAVCEFVIRAGDIARHCYDGDYVALQRLFLIQVCQHLDKQVDTFIMELIASAVKNQERVAGHFSSADGISHREDLLSAHGAKAFFLLAINNRVAIYAVDSDAVRLPVEEALALLGGDIAHGGEHIGVLS